MASAKKSKNQLRRERAKQKKTEAPKQATPEPQPDTAAGEADAADFLESSLKHEIDSYIKTHPNVEYIEDARVRKVLDNDPNFQEFKLIFEKFRSPLEEPEVEEEVRSAVNGVSEIIYSSDEEAEVTKTETSKRQKRLRNKMSLAELKAHAKYPNQVEWYDVDAPDPELLVSLKTQKNVVPVPLHWQLRKDYLSSKKGVEKPPFRLPSFILDTGIADMRNTGAEDTAATLKQKTRERVQPKMGKLDIDYNKLYNAFFKFQQKPPLSLFGEVFFEGKNHETSDLAQYRPGHYSSELRAALGMSSQLNALPPWIMTMVAMGTPPAYPYMRLPVVQPNGDLVYAEEPGIKTMMNDVTNVEKQPWGVVQVDIEPEVVPEIVSEELKAEEEASPVRVDTGIPITEFGGLAKKRSVEEAFDEETANEPPRKLYQVLEQQNTATKNGLSDARYVLPGSEEKPKKSVKSAPMPEVKKDKFRF
ncbi:hypothetical protein BABINDRAFT_162887 [Babjeviella inositovora NRRL Y-12698]|uniref:PSP proline-rich domain-containing protein n=1 Tax=Babjeviella inositovora NRRL Y-12698 TaxID=984486 RepID=A0A1E3QKL2_9ASCO|nr:uncharacterized protein BABINDRAFT_162887 [Babjeviella inositovora NRRL Y-12698]ODQ78223.1 hypothetical protein BABINDRAFT_162887 [Babjeviella inositovora NRRL Y-12698]